jgi:hypothetical protein
MPGLGRYLGREIMEERFGGTIGEADLLPENFASVNTICAHLRARELGKREAAHG